MISVCLTTYNGEKYISEQILSILNQLSEEDEIVVSDDGSVDATLSIINQINDSRIKIIRHQTYNKKSKFSFDRITRNFENALNNAKGDLIFLSDQDDIWLSNKVDIIKNIFNKNDCWLILHDCIIVDKNKVPIVNSYFKLNKSKPGCIYNLFNCSYLGSCMVFKRELLNKALPFPEKPVPHDLWLGLIAEKNKKVFFLNEKLMLYRRHENNQSTSGSKSKFNFLEKTQYRIIIFNELIKRTLHSSRS